MILVCAKQFGNFVPGDEVEVPDGAIFDTEYFKAVDDKPKTKTKKDEG